MSRQVTTTQLWESIRTAGLASADDCRKWAREVTEALGKSVITDPEQLTATLIRFGYLTPYQGNVIRRGLPHPLLLEGVRVEHSLEDRLGPHWYQGQTQAPDPTDQRPSNEKKAGSSTPVWVAALSMESMATPLVRAWPPSMAWAEHHALVQSPHLDRWRTPGATLQHLFAFVEPWNSISLAHRLESGPLDPLVATQLVHDIASALQSLHQAGLVHGHLSLDAILVEQDGTFRLRRDPLFPPRSPYQGETPSVIQTTHPLLAVAAPELAIPDTIPSPQSDLYALGCIWYRCIASRWPVQPADRASAITWGSLHARIPIQVPDALPETATKCLLHLLAKDPTARFASAKSLLAALNSDPATQSQPVIAPAETTSPLPTINEPSASYTVTRPDDNPSIATPKSAPPAEPLSVQQLASDIRDKTAKVTPRERLRRKGPKPLLAQPVQPPSTSVQPVVQSQTPVAKPTTVKPQIPPQPLPSQTKVTEAKATPVAAPSAALRTPTLPAPPASQPSKKSPVKKKKKKSAQDKKGSAKTKGKSKGKRPVWVMPALVSGSCVLLVALTLLLRGNTPSVVTIEKTPSKGARSNPVTTRDEPQPAATKNPADPLAERFDVVTDEGKVPWAPPSAGSPYGTELLPSGMEALVFISSRAWQHEGPVGPLVAWWNSLASEPGRPWWPETSVPPNAIDQVAVAWYPGNAPGTSRYAVRFAFKSSRKISDIIDTSAWSPQTIAASSDAGRGSVWVRKDAGSFRAMLCDDLTASENAVTRYATFGPKELLENILASKTNPFVMRRQLDTLRQASDASSDLTLLIAPSFLYGDGKEILGPDSPRLLGLLSQIVDDKVQAWMVRAQWDKEWYLEWRTLGNDLQAAFRNATTLKSKLQEVATGLEAALVNQPADPYWRAIANRFPQMLRALSKWMRTGSEEGQVVVNAYMPTEALSNLLIGSWMAAQRDWNAVASTPPANKPAAQSKGIEEWLATPISLRIEQDSLENVLQAVATELKEASGSQVDPLPMAINGPAFQKDGITRNQQVRNFDYANTPIRQVLTTLARRANPVTTVEAPNEKDQKVVWVILDDPATPSKKKLEFSTRSWAEANAATLPTEFVLPAN